MRRASVAVWGLLTFLAPAAAAAAPVNDDFANRLTLQLGWADTRSNVEATTEAEEPLTASDPAARTCANEGGSAGQTPSKVDKTLWWEFTGTGGPITLSTQGSNFDTVLAVYETVGRVFIACNDDLQPYDTTRPLLEYRVTSELVVNTQAGVKYAVQVGGCSPQPPCASPTSGNITLRVSPPPENDARAAAHTLVAGTPRTGTNTGATLEPGELAVCRRYDGQDALYAKTVWYRYQVPAKGTAVFSAAGEASANPNLDTVIAVYRGDSTTPIGCNDDSVAGGTGPSRLPMSQPPGPPVEVEAGDYFIQVGGYYDAGFSTVAARNGPLTVQVEFTADTDLDDDGVHRDQDCNDNDPAIRPGAREIANNDVDENCDGIKAQDQDGDGVYAPAAGEDCNDQDPRIRPGAPEIEGNGIDEDCNGQDPPNRDRDADGVLNPPFGDDCQPDNARIHQGAPEIPENGIDEDCDQVDPQFPKFDPPVRWEMGQKRVGGRIRIYGLYALEVPAGAKVQLRCSSCRGRAERRLRRRVARLGLLGELRQLLRVRRGRPVLVRAGTKIEFRVTKKSYTGYGVSIVASGGSPKGTPFCIGPKGRREC